MADRAEMIALAERLDESAGIAPLFVLVGLIPIGIRVLRQSDEAWERRAVAGEVRSATA